MSVAPAAGQRWGASCACEEIYPHSNRWKLLSKLVTVTVDDLLLVIKLVRTISMISDANKGAAVRANPILS